MFCCVLSGLKSNNDCFHLIVTSSCVRFLLPSVCPVFASLTCLYIHVSFFLLFFLVFFFLVVLLFYVFNLLLIASHELFPPVSTCVICPLPYIHTCVSLWFCPFIFCFLHFCSWPIRAHFLITLPECCPQHQGVLPPDVGARLPFCH